MRTSFDFFAIIAVTWALASVGLTILLYGQLGTRGLFWLSIHHTFCLIGCTHEYFRYQNRQDRLK